MFFLKLLTNKDVIHINFHSPQALPTLHLLLADFVGTSDPRQEWQTQHLSCSVLQAAWQCQGSADHSKSPFWAECVPQRSWHSLFYEWKFICTYRWCRGLPKLSQFVVDQEREWGWVVFRRKAASPCLLPQTTCGRSEGALFCPYQTSPSFVGHLRPLEKHTYWLILIMDLYSFMQWAMCSAWKNSHYYPCRFPQ